jgi:hypothetical protein
MVIIKVTRFPFPQIVHRRRFQSFAGIPSYNIMSSPFVARRRVQSPDISFKDASHFINFDEFPAQDSDQLIFGPLDLEDAHSTSPSFQWPDIDPDVKPPYNFSSFSTMSHYEFGPSSANSYYDSGTLYPPIEEQNLDLAGWINDPDLGPNSSSSPIPIPSPTDTSTSSFIGYQDHTRFSPDPTTFSPTSFAALHPLPRSMSPPSFGENYSARPRVHSVISPRDMSLHTPVWATQLWDAPSALRTQTSLARPSVRHSPLTDTLRQRVPVRRPSLSSGQPFQSSSAPSFTESRVPASSRTYSRRADSVVSDDRDATVKRKKRSPEEEAPITATKVNDSRKMFHRIFVIPFQLIMYVSTQVCVTSSETGTFGLAALLYGLDTKAASLRDTQVECRSSG